MKTAPDHLENLSGTPAVKKIQDLAKAARVCLFGTSPGQHPLDVVPMAVQDVDDAGDLWFLSGRSSNKNQHIAGDSRVQLFFANTGDSQYLSLHGTATISDSRLDKEAHWTPLAKAWFQDGIDDPELTVIRVTPIEGHYWDTVHGKTVSTLKIALGAITGRKMDDGVQGLVRP